MKRCLAGSPHVFQGEPHRTTEVPLQAVQTLWCRAVQVGCGASRQCGYGSGQDFWARNSKKLKEVQRKRQFKGNSRIFIQVFSAFLWGMTCWWSPWKAMSTRIHHATGWLNSSPEQLCVDLVEALQATAKILTRFAAGVGPVDGWKSSAEAFLNHF